MNKFLYPDEQPQTLIDAEIIMYNDRVKHCKDHGKVCDESCLIFGMCNEWRDKLFPKEVNDNGFSADS